MERLDPNVFWKPEQVAEFLSVSRSFVYKLVHSGELPPPTMLGERGAFWRKSEIFQWALDYFGITMEPENKFLRVQEVARVLSVHVSFVYKLLARTDFPKPVRPKNNHSRWVVWLDTEVYQWIRMMMERAKTEKLNQEEFCHATS